MNNNCIHHSYVSIIELSTTLITLSPFLVYYLLSSNILCIHYYIDLKYKNILSCVVLSAFPNVNNFFMQNTLKQCNLKQCVVVESYSIKEIMPLMNVHYFNERA